MKKFCGLFLLLGMCDANADQEDLVRELYGKVEELTHKVDLLEKKLATLPAPTDETDTTKEKSVEGDPYQKEIEKLSPEEVIKKAKHDIEDNKYEKARGVLNAFVVKNPKNLYIGMMQYYIGKSFFEEQNYEKAATAYIECFGTNANGAKTPKALYQLAVCFKKLGKDDQMQKTLDKLIDTYPNCKYVKKAKKLKKKK